MEKKINNYIDVLFSDVPRSKKATELKEEIRANMLERYQDCINEGQSETQAYSSTIANLGDVDEMLSSVMPDAEFKQEAQRYRDRNAKFTGVGVGLYILGAAVVVCGGLLGENAAVIGIVSLLVLAAIATGMIIYANMSTPQEYKDFDRDEVISSRVSPEKNKLLQSIMSLYWTIIVAAYLAWSFFSGNWHISWIIWPFAAVLSGIVKLVFEMRNRNE